MVFRGMRGRTTDVVVSPRGGFNPPVLESFFGVQTWGSFCFSIASLRMVFVWLQTMLVREPVGSILPWVVSPELRASVSMLCHGTSGSGPARLIWGESHPSPQTSFGKIGPALRLRRYGPIRQHVLPISKLMIFRSQRRSRPFLKRTSSSDGGARWADFAK